MGGGAPLLYAVCAGGILGYVDSCNSQENMFSCFRCISLFVFVCCCKVGARFASLRLARFANRFVCLVG